jgi:hypothetical protein
MGDDLEKTIKIVQFSGKQEDWRKWSKKFLARAAMKKYKGVLLGTVVVPAESDVLDTRTNDGKLLKAARDANEIAYNELLLCSDDDVAFTAVDTACTQDLPSGSAKLAWDNLIAKYEPKTSASKAALKYKFEASKMKDELVHPDTWLAELEQIRQQLASMNSPISDEDMMLHVLVHLPKSYDTVAEQLERRVGHATSPLTLDELREELRNKFLRIQRHNEDEEATALATRSTKNKFFKGTCRLCGKYGHRGSDCWTKNNSQTTMPTSQQDKDNKEKNKNNKECKYCKRSGHTVDECWKLKNKKEREEKEKNDDKNKKNENNKKEKKEDQDVVMITTLAESYTALQCAEYKKKNDYELWIGDTGATAHMSNSPDGFENIKYIPSRIKMGNNDILNSPFYGDKRMIVIQKEKNLN